jgi:hypothetical protein
MSLGKESLGTKTTREQEIKSVLLLLACGSSNKCQLIPMVIERYLLTRGCGILSERH